jgi:hypothetical protein
MPGMDAEERGEEGELADEAGAVEAVEMTGWPAGSLFRLSGIPPFWNPDNVSFLFPFLYS